jgi:hypothetical protein
LYYLDTTLLLLLFFLREGVVLARQRGESKEKEDITKRNYTTQ